ncbi:hypothetical protein CTI12_AA491820 [Artemisia annua]|uniref:Uncharacterized protein n=1 Tax=Artemisia annua TaxID=35608 RepID=A0A2U1LGP3_ARTAN|nr:hypothetical protein CTI12_AA491820 [Artemisia annua]
MWLDLVNITGNCVFQSDLTKKKLAEVQKVLDMDAMEDANETLDKSQKTKQGPITMRHPLLVPSSALDQISHAQRTNLIATKCFQQQ